MIIWDDAGAEPRLTGVIAVPAPTPECPDDFATIDDLDFGLN